MVQWQQWENYGIQKTEFVMNVPKVCDRQRRELAIFFQESYFARNTHHLLSSTMYTGVWRYCKYISTRNTSISWNVWQRLIFKRINIIFFRQRVIRRKEEGRSQRNICDKNWRYIRPSNSKTLTLPSIMHLPQNKAISHKHFLPSSEVRSHQESGEQFGSRYFPSCIEKKAKRHIKQAQQNTKRWQKGTSIYFWAKSAICTVKCNECGKPCVVIAKIFPQENKARKEMIKRINIECERKLYLCRYQPITDKSGQLYGEVYVCERSHTYQAFKLNFYSPCDKVFYEPVFVECGSNRDLELDLPRTNEKKHIPFVWLVFLL